MLHRPILVLTAFLLLPSLYATADFTSDTRDAARTIQPIMPQAESLLADGQWDAANAKILAAFPEKTRTTAQTNLLGNVLFSQDPKTSYELHKQAATELPDEPAIQLEWAMEQHRAGEYAGAAIAYAKFSKANPGYAPAYGLAAECLLRTGQIQEALDAWNHSEQAPQGSLEQFESMVCEVNGHRFPHRDRAALLAKAGQGDIDAAEKLIALDCDFPRDWWNAGPKKDYLAKDLELLRKTRFADADRLKEILTAGSVAAPPDNAKVGDLLRQAGFLLDEKGTLPQSGVLLSTMLQAAISAHALSEKDAREKWGSTILEKAKAAPDTEMFNVAAHLYLRTDRLAEIDRLGWESTGDVRFAASLLAGLMAREQLKLDDPALIKAAAQFPEDAIIAGIVVSLTPPADKAIQPVLMAAIKAEYTHFSLQGPLTPRPGAAPLRRYFSALGATLQKK